MRQREKEAVEQVIEGFNFHEVQACIEILKQRRVPRKVLRKSARKLMRKALRSYGLVRNKHGLVADMKRGELILAYVPVVTYREL